MTELVARTDRNGLRPASQRGRLPSVRARRVSLWTTVATLALAFVVGNGLDVLHFALVSHHWCALHEQFEHARPLSTASCTTHVEPAQSVSVTDADEGVHGRESGCAVLSSQHQQIATISVASPPLGLLAAQAPASGVELDVEAGAPRLSLAPKRSPPLVAS